MPAIVRKTDLCTGHDCWPERTNTSWSPNVFANNLNVVRRTDTWETHTCVSSHTGVQETHSPNVYANGLQVARIGDDIDCGSKNKTGSPNVFVNGP
ncbi:MAG: PaaR repeat-containing protein [Epsilonproteobacteria bacterium]|nr:MAG: PaaR repeat-containing protein [Campylobacterota bacterium]